MVGEEDVLSVDAIGLRSRFSDIFHDPLIVIRELVQNSVEAVRRRKPLDPKIEILVEPNKRRISVQDNGVGMAAQQARLAMTRFFGSFWEGNEERNNTSRMLDDLVRLRIEHGGTSELEHLNMLRGMASGSNFEATSDRIGRYGVGLTTALMIADTLVVDTFAESESHATLHKLFVAKDGNNRGVVRYVGRFEPSKLQNNGTIVSLHVSPDIRDQLLSVNGLDPLDARTVEELVRKYAYLVEIPIYVNGVLVVGAEQGADAQKNKMRNLYETSAKEDGLVFPFELDKAGKEGYCSAILGFAASSSSHPKIQVWSRGILVGFVSSAVCLGNELGFIGGVLDTDLFDLQFDRNQPELNSNLLSFQKSIQIWIANEISLAAQNKTVEYCRSAGIHRKEILLWLLSNEEAFDAVAKWTPFSVVKGVEGRRSLRTVDSIFSSAVELNGNRFVPFTTPRSREADLTANFFSARGHALVMCETYLPTEHGEANIDLHFIAQYSNRLLDSPVVERADVLLGEALEASRIGSDHMELEKWLEDSITPVAKVYFIEEPDLEQPVSVSVSRNTMLDKELPGLVQENPLVGLLKELVRENGDQEFAQMIEHLEEERMQAKIYLNKSDRRIFELVESAESSGRGGFALRALTITASLNLPGVYDGSLETEWSLLLDQLVLAAGTA